VSRLVRINFVPWSSTQEVRAALVWEEKKRFAVRGASYSYVRVDGRFRDDEIVVGVRNALNAWDCQIVESTTERLDVAVLLRGDVVSVAALNEFQRAYWPVLDGQQRPMRRTLIRDPETGEIAGSIEEPVGA